MCKIIQDLSQIFKDIFSLTATNHCYVKKELWIDAKFYLWQYLSKPHCLERSLFEHHNAGGTDAQLGIDNAVSKTMKNSGISKIVRDCIFKIVNCKIENHGL